MKSPASFPRPTRRALGHHHGRRGDTPPGPCQQGKLAWTAVSKARCCNLQHFSDEHHIQEGGLLGSQLKCCKNLLCYQVTKYLLVCFPGARAGNPLLRVDDRGPRRLKLSYRMSSVVAKLVAQGVSAKGTRTPRYLVS